MITNDIFIEHTKMITYFCLHPEQTLNFIHIIGNHCKIGIILFIMCFLYS
jgi:hypothetical protein